MTSDAASRAKLAELVAAGVVTPAAQEWAGAPQRLPVPVGGPCTFASIAQRALRMFSVTTRNSLVVLVRVVPLLTRESREGAAAGSAETAGLRRDH